MTEIGCLSCRVAIYFAANPGATLTTKQIAEMFFAQEHKVAGQLRASVVGGYFTSKREGVRSRGGSFNVYSSGPQIERFRDQRASQHP